MASEVGCPFVGLVPYTEDEARFFFGRARETQQIIANLFASRLTLLYGASGVGKSSVLCAGVLYELERRAARAAAQGKAPEEVAVYLKDWQGDVVARFRQTLRGALAKVFPDAGDVVPPDGIELADVLTAVSEQTKADMLVVLDQFEEYFLYHGEEKIDDEPFARQLAAAINHPGLPASFLVVLRDDALARLDRFKARIPGLFSNYLRLRPLAEEAARAAIVEPVRVYSELTSAPSDGGPVRVELELVSAVVEQVRRGRVQVGEGRRGGAEGSEAGIEAPFLQLVMTRVWDEEIGSGSRVLRAQTLANLGGAEKIVRGHLDRVIGQLSKHEYRICARIFHHLVTPSGAKIAHTAADLAGIAEIEPSRMEHLLARISGSRMRILTPVAPAGAVGEVRYEIFHDALAQAMVEWRRRYVEERQRYIEKRQRQELEKERRTARRLRWLAIGLAGFITLTLAAIVFAWIQSRRAESQSRRAIEIAMVVEQQEREVRVIEERMKGLEDDLKTAELAGNEKQAAELRLILAEDEKKVAQLRLKRAERQISELMRDRDSSRTRAEAAEKMPIQVEDGRDQHEIRAQEAEQKLAAVETELELAQAKIVRLRQDIEAILLKPYKVESLGMSFVPIPSGRFRLGSPEDEKERAINESPHEVEIIRGYWMAETEVTQGQWRNMMGNNPSRFVGCGDDCPVENVTWFDAVAFANHLSKHEGLETCFELSECENSPGTRLRCHSVIFAGLDCRGYRLPTEAEWEYAARAGTTTPFWTGENLTTAQANYNGNVPYAGHAIGEYRGHTVAVRSFNPNPWGLYEIHGNVWEWNYDWYGAYPKKPAEDRGGPVQGSVRVVRGGSWFSYARDCRSAFRSRGAPGIRGNALGFRLVRSLSSTP